MKGLPLRIVTLAVALILLIAATGAVVHGQAAAPTATPVTASPTPVATPLPAGSWLLQRMRAAMTQRKSFRVETTATSTWKGHWVQSVTWMDMDIAANTMREVDSVQRMRTDAPAVKLSIWRRQLLFAHETAASRTPRTSWYCESLHGVAVKDGLIAFQIQSAHVANLGPARMDGVAVWHLRAAGASVSAWSTGATTVDLYVSSKDDTLVRLDLHTAGRLGGHFERDAVSESYSRYGSAVKVVLPAKCR
jgi:hypothetical protein